MIAMTSSRQVTASTDGQTRGAICALLLAICAWTTAGAELAATPAATSGPAPPKHAEASTAEAEQPLTLEAIWKHADENGPGLKAARARIRSARAARRALPRAYVPDLHAEGGYSAAANSRETEQGPLARLVAAWTLWDGGRTEMERRTLTAQARALSARATQEVLERRTEIARIFFRVQQLESAAAIETARRASYKTLAAALGVRIRIGRAGRSQLSELSIKQNRAEARAQNLRDEARIERASLALLSGIKEITPERALTIRKIDADSEQPQLDFEQLPLVQALRSEIVRLRAESKLAERRLYWPTLGLEAYGGFGPHVDAIEARRPEVGVRFAIRLPLLNRRDRAAQSTALAEGIAAREFDVERALVSARIEWQRLAGRLSRNQRTEKALSEALRESEKNLQAAYTEYARGLRAASDVAATFEDHFDMQRKLERIRAKLNEDRATLEALRRITAQKNKTGAQSPESKEAGPSKKEEGVRP